MAFYLGVLSFVLLFLSIYLGKSREYGWASIPALFAGVFSTCFLLVVVGTNFELQWFKGLSAWLGLITAVVSFSWAFRMLWKWKPSF